ncbi:nitrite/sulfite reductase [Stackebrandtia nassauensis]|uniref:assimilatory sulfite reductase (ferredoxin) n=1 Tax=Stackebrandtia nassauensis (strain DSM 44728 / CIP 108903 / NRRL B-16338 / NBRC 102104 / LLR-40K-21) TaxID=446470 RepID=D3QBR3_STANL|nr:Sulfite reductase (ferredoxin) [Stackebrandtia nassauensis DSM 44728]
MPPTLRAHPHTIHRKERIVPTATRGRAKGQGQWALGHREPLNKNEQSKKDDNPLNVRARIENIYAHGGFDSIDPADLRGRFRWWGLYTQRKAGIDGGKTAILEDEDLDDRYFMMRVRMDGGQLSLEQLRAVAEISKRYGRDTADVTDRQNIQLHWIEVEDVPAIWNALEAVGLTTQEACGDCPRVILGSPVAGISADERIDPTPLIEEITSEFVGDKSLSNLPRKFKSAISWLPDIPYECNDISFLGAEHPEHGPGFDLWVGGGLSTNPMLAKRLGTWIPAEKVAEVWAAVVRLFRDYGYRRLRHRARLKFLVNDWGVDEFRRVVEEEYLGYRLDDLAPPPVPERLLDHIGVHKQADGKFYIGAAPTVGRVSGTLLSQLADIAERYGSGRIRTTPMQKLLLLDVDEADVDDAVRALDDIGLSANPSGWRRATMACTGIEFCKLAIVDTKDRATALVSELERRVPELDVPISVHVNGCPNACARTQTADIGLKGQLMTVDGKQVPGFQVHLGGGHGVHAGFGRKLRGLKVSSDELGDYITNLARRYLSGRLSDETFAEWVVRVDETDLR